MHDQTKMRSQRKKGHSYYFTSNNGAVCTRKLEMVHNSKPDTGDVKEKGQSC